MDYLKFFKKKEKSKNIAKDRLKLVLVHDRSDLSPKFLEMIKNDIVKVISQYVVLDEENLEIKLTRVKRSNERGPISALVANIPIVKVKNQGRNSQKEELLIELRPIPQTTGVYSFSQNRGWEDILELRNLKIK